jgi:ABC-2 type transport system permease protein
MADARPSPDADDPNPTGSLRMNAIATSTNALPNSAAPNALRAYALEAKCEFLRVLRTPSFAFPSLMFPPLFYLLFAILLNHGNDGSA